MSSPGKQGNSGLFQRQTCVLVLFPSELKQQGAWQRQKAAGIFRFSLQEYSEGSSIRNLAGAGSGMSGFF